jgi:hypothetical protein
MRKFIIAGALAVIGIALLAVPASASFDHHFSVLAKTIAFRPTGEDAFRFRERLYAPHNRHDRVGRDRARCKGPRHHLNCHAVIYLNGEIGGQGKLKVEGDIERGDRRLDVLGGTGDFNGVGGKFVFHHLRGPRLQKYHFDLVR